METLRSRLDYVSSIYHRQVGPCLISIGVGLHNSPAIAWTGGMLLFLITLNKVRTLR